MAHFAEIDKNNIVLRVVVIPDEQEHRGNDFLSIDMRFGGNWKQTSYHGSIRGKFAGIGDIYSAEFDVFASPQPGPGWTLQPTGEWLPPAKPAGVGWFMSEGSIDWHLDINKADGLALDLLDGVGPALAADIIQERGKGDFSSIHDIATRVNGISKTVASSWANVVVG